MKLFQPSQKQTFQIYTVHEPIGPYDAKVFNTIEHIVVQFFLKAENALIYICSDEEQKAKLRYNSFNRWYNHSKFSTTIGKIDNVFNI